MFFFLNEPLYLNDFVSQEWKLTTHDYLENEKNVVVFILSENLEVNRKHYL